METHSKALVEAIVRILTPLVRILLKSGVSCGAFTELVRRVYVEVADRDFTVSGRKQSVSRIAVITGLNRKEVTRIRGLPPIDSTEIDERYNRAARVISGWLRDPQFLDKKGDPDALPFEGEHSFSALVKKYSGDMPARAVADELMRVQAVEHTAHGELRLTARGYVPRGSEVEKLQVLGTDTRDLIATIEHNLTHPPEQARFQRKVGYDNLPIETGAAFHKLSTRLGQGVLEQLNEWLAERDRDCTPDVEGSGRMRLGLGIYVIEEVIEEGTKDQRKKPTRPLQS